MAECSAWKASGYEMSLITKSEIKMGPPSKWIGSEPPVRGCEVYITDLPKDCHIDELMNVCNNISPVYIARMKVEKSLRCRGFAFVQFCSPMVAKLAAARLNGAFIRPGVKITATMSIDNRRLRLIGIPIWLNIEDVQKRVKKYVDTVVYIDRLEDDMLLWFKDHSDASKAKKILGQNTKKLWGEGVITKWGDPEF